ncbi:hypothetical protein AZE42_03444 [Rhizopogon vesiculosus]|uniref:Uncharacterized protein n=1 Tax=Rhizopogon vesiculosus TaxID=180088 RepID=A0A1J8QRQ1_9AGAM|nr:hypothetical protein AZE42_03444 [Rhizopogon vesiculosus]
MLSLSGSFQRFVSSHPARIPRNPVSSTGLPASSAGSSLIMMDIDSPPSQDPAQSLRAAALLSRKRRKVAVEQVPPLPQRPQVEQTMQLDYGQEELPSSRPFANYFPTQNKVPSTSEEPPPDSTPDIEDGQIREEGEISDTEESAPPPPQRPTSPPPKFRRLETSSKDNITSRPVPTSPVIDSNPPPRSSNRLDSPFVPSKTASESSFQHPSPSFSHPFILETSTYRLDADHVRPGLAMSQDQYNTAKDMVLDLLGWAVPPEYLVDCGLSRQVVFYVFTELNLRMPTNLDTTDLIPYPTPEMMSPVPASPSHSIRSVSTSSAMPPPITIPSHKDFSSPIATSGHASDRTGSKLAARLGLRIPSAPEPTDVKMEPTSPSAADSPSSQFLHMIEQQKRRELLARKVVSDSRKAKQSDSPGGPSSTRDRDVEQTHVAATEIVEDFLKSIPAVDNDVTDSPIALRAARYASPETMEVDEAFTALVAPQSASSEDPSGRTLFTSTDSRPSETRSTISPTTDAPPSSGYSMALSSDTYSGTSLSATSAPGDYMAASSSAAPNFASTSPAYDTNGLQRRGTKRPVAADFVDFDHGPGTSRAPSGNGYSSNGYIQPVPLLRRKAGSFAGVSGVRRCVIELSDSEDDGDGEYTGGPALYDGLSSYSPVVSARLPRFGGNGTSNSFANGEARSTTPNGNAPLGMSPAALAEKEEEIKKMRQMIAQREELRQKKLAAMSGKATTTTQPAVAGPSTTEGVVVSVNTLMVTSDHSRLPIKQEDNAIFLHNGHVGEAESSEQVDAIMEDTQDNGELASADISVVNPIEEPVSGESSNDLVTSDQTIGSSRFFTSPTPG